MKRLSPATAARYERSAAAKRTLLALGDSCEWCLVRTGLDLHHVAGRTGELIDDTRFLLLLCRDCHKAVEERVLGEDGIALALALLRHMGRGTVKEYWEVTGRKYPRECVVNKWCDRLERRYRKDLVGEHF